MMLDACKYLKSLSRSNFEVNRSIRKDAIVLNFQMVALVNSYLRIMQNQSLGYKLITFLV